MTTDRQPMQHFVDALEGDLTRAGAVIERRTHARRRILRLAATTGALAVAATAVGFGVGSGGDGTGDDGAGSLARLGVAQAAAAERCGTPSTGSSGVRSCLGALGTVAADWEAPGTGEVLYEQRRAIGSTRTVRPDGRPTPHTNDPSAYTLAYPVTTDLWIAPSGAGRSVVHPQGAPFLPTARDRRRWKALGSPPLGDAPPAGSVGASGDGLTTTSDGRTVETWGAGGAQERALHVGEQGEDGGPTLFEGDDPTRTLSRQPAALLEELRRLAWRQRVAISGDPCPGGFGRCPAATERSIGDNVGTLATGLLAYPATPRDLRAALLRMLADLPGAATLGTRRDALRRPGTVVRLPPGVNDGQDLLLFDTASARLLALGTARRTGEDDPLWQTHYGVDVHRVEEVAAAPRRPAEGGVDR